MRRFERHAWIALAALGIGLLAVTDRDAVVLDLAVVAAMLLLAWWVSPWRGGRTVRHDDLAALPANRQRVVAYWRPGCLYCSRLRWSLGARRSHVTWVNIWQDDSAARFVRSVNDGNETVPTVVIDGEALTNPDPDVVRAHLV